MTTDKKKNTFIVLSINVIFSLLLTNSIDFHRPFYAERIVIIGLFYFVLLVFLPLLAYWDEAFGNWVSRQFERIRSCAHWILSNPWKVIKGLFFYGCGIILGFIAGHVFCYFRHIEYNLMLSVFAIGVLYLLITCFLMRKVSAKYPERLFLAVVIGVGTIMILASPVSVGVSWDDEIHYEKAEVIPDLITGKRFETDERLIHDFGPTFDDYYFRKDLRAEKNTEYNALYKEGKTTGESNEKLSVQTIAFLPYDAAIIAARGLRLPFTVTFRFAKIVNLITYAVIVTAAAKKLKAGKFLVLMIGMIPTAWFMAVNYSYDPWLISWTLYGFCSFLQFLQNKEKKMTGIDMIQIIGAYVIGCMPKAVYLVLMFPLLFMPTRAFKNKKQRALYVSLVLLGALFLAGSFVIPLLAKGAGKGDARGGPGVNATEQLKLILDKPGWYAGVLARFIIHFINPIYAKGYLQNFNAYSYGWFGGLTTVLYFLIALFDKNGEKSKRWFDIPVSILTFLACMAIIATALYITYTPVGLDTVNGCQHRYIIPALAGLLYMIMPDRIRNPVKPELFINLPVIFVTTTFLARIMYCMAAIY